VNAILHAVAHALEPFHRLDPTGWMGWHTLLTPTLAILALAVGLFCASVGAKPVLFRGVAVPLGLLLGVGLTDPVLRLLSGTSLPVKVIEVALPVALAVLGAIVPQTIAFVALGAVGAVIGREVVSEHELLVGAVPGFFLAGVLGIVFSRIVDTLAAAALGGLLVAGGVLAVAPKAGLVRALEGSPWGPIALAVVIFAAGAALQFVTHEDDDVKAARTAAKANKKAKKADDQARAARFSKQGK
jgi:hypothetical protein